VAEAAALPVLSGVAAGVVAGDADAATVEVRAVARAAEHVVLVALLIREEVLLPWWFGFALPFGEVQLVRSWYLFFSTSR